MSRFRTFAALVLVALALAGCRSRSTVTAATKKSDRVTNREVRLFYESPQRTLVPERRTLPLPEDDTAAFAPTLRELAKGPRVPSIVRLLPPDTVVRAAFLLPDGNAVIDLGGATLTNGWNTGSDVEMMAIDSILLTAQENFSSVRRVRLLVNGQVVDTLGGHIRLDRPISRPLLAPGPKR